MYVYYLDLEKEKELGIGKKWQYSDLAEGECVLTSDYQEEFDLEVG